MVWRELGFINPGVDWVTAIDREFDAQKFEDFAAFDDLESRVPGQRLGGEVG